MNAKITVMETFQKSFKRLQKKFPKITDDYEKLLIALAKQPQIGDAIPEFGGKIRKVRMASTDMKKGKSGGFRIIYFLWHEEKEISLLDIYGKFEQENVSKKHVQMLLEQNEIDY